MNERGRLTDVFLKACTLAPCARAAYLDEACGGDAALRSEVEAMLAADDRAEASGTGGLADLVGRAAASAATESKPAPHPDHIGPYKVLDLLGEGGMGVVYRALQTEPVRREVAVKLVRAGFDSAGAVVRFESERQALALMDHPNVAHLYDAGTTPDGRPYFVMELVHGLPITDYCSRESLSPRQRVELFLGVCRGVRHAHRRGVIHRDLKPSNILVALEEGQAVPKVIDFSISKALGEPAPGTEFRTRTGQIIGTLDYMSPEQAVGRAGAADMRSDVYALGVVLYELLADRRPHAIEGLPLHEAVRRIVEDPPTSFRGATKTRGTRVGEDVETIVGKCLEKDPERRYGSAAELVEDLERSLESRPILARPPSTVYQMRKLVGRHRAIFASAALAVTLLLVFSVTVTIQLGIQRRERRRAESEAAKAQRVNTFLQEMLAAADPAKQGGKVSIREVLDQAAKRVDELKDQPEIEAELHRTLGETYAALGVAPQEKAHYERALAGFVRIYGEDHPETARTRLDLAGTMKGENRYEEAEREARRALETFRRIHPGDDPLVADSLDKLAEIDFQAGKLEESRRVAEEVLAMRRRMPGEDAKRLARSLDIYGTTLTALGQRAEGEKLLREAVAVMKAKRDRGLAYLDVLSDLACNLGIQSKLEEGTALNEEVLRGRIETLGRDHFMTALTENNLATTLLGQGRCAEAESHVMEALRVWRLTNGEEHRDVAVGWNNLGSARMCYGDYEGARDAIESSWRIARKRPEIASIFLPVFCHNRGIIQGRTGNLREGERVLRALLDGSQECGGKPPTDSSGALYELGSLLLEENRPGDAETRLRESLRVQEAVITRDGGSIEENAGLSVPINALGRSLAAQGKVDEAQSLLAEARSRLLGSVEAADARRHEMRRTAELYDRLHRPAEAALYRQALVRLDAVTKSRSAP